MNDRTTRTLRAAISSVILQLFLVAALPAVARALPPRPVDPPVYAAPLIGQYAIERRANWQTDGDGPLTLINAAINPDGDSPLRIVQDVRQIAVAGRYIVGSSGSGYFIFDTGQLRDAQLFDSADDWKAALAADGLGDVHMQNPDAIAASMPDRLVRPWEYTQMNGLLGLSDDGWEGLVTYSALGAVFLIALSGRLNSYRWVMIVVIILGTIGFTVDFMDAYLADHAPIAPSVEGISEVLLFGIATLFGAAVRRAVKRPRSPQIS
jgi:hypothetical protein